MSAIGPPFHRPRRGLQAGAGLATAVVAALGGLSVVAAMPDVLGQDGRANSSPGSATAPAASSDEATRSMDLVVLRDERRIGGRLLAVTPETLRIHMVVDGSRGQGSASRSIAMSDVERISFGLTQSESQLLAAPDAGTVDAIEQIWNRRRVYLRYPRSEAARFGLEYARRLLERDGPRDAEKALETCDAIAASDWNAGRKAEARVGRLRALLRLGRAEEAVAEAERLAEETDDPRMLVESRHVLALADFDALRSLVDEHPRWREDDEVAPLWHERFDRALDGFLFPFLFHGTLSAEAARGLAKAREVCLFGEREAHARSLARDLVELYPDSIEAAAATRFLNPENGPTAEP